MLSRVCDITDLQDTWGIPSLDINFQPALLPQPFLPWGCMKRSQSHQGSYHFYVNDAKFEYLWKLPDQVFASGVITLCEVNFTIDKDAPKAFALWQICRKRSLSRYWQAAGIDILVDLNVVDCFLDLALVGVPQGWKAYSTRGYAELPESDLIDRWHLAQKHSGIKKPLFVVYAGGQRIQELCKEYGWEYHNTFRGTKNVQR